MSLDAGLITALLIEYDSEHPATLGEMADRRAIYAKRLVDMSAHNVQVQKFTNRLGDGVGTDYVIPNPFHTMDIVVRQFLTATGDELMDAPDIDSEYIRFHYHRIIQPGEINVVIYS